MLDFASDISETPGLDDCAPTSIYLDTDNSRSINWMDTLQYQSIGIDMEEEFVVYIRQDIPYCRIPNNESLGIEHLSVDIIVNKQVYNINTFYRPPNEDPVSHNRFLTDISTTLKTLRKHSCYKTLICGDMNFGSIYNHFGSLTEKPLDTKAPEIFGNNGFVQLVDLPTRYSSLSVSLIDLIF